MPRFNINNPSGGGGTSSDTVAYEFFANSSLKVPQFLKTDEKVYSNVNPKISDRTGFIQTAVISNDLGELDQFAFGVFINGVQQYTNTKAAATTRQEFTGLNISISQGDEISVRIFNMLAPIDDPRCILILRGI